jgi:hypothetical protein
MVEYVADKITTGGVFEAIEFLDTKLWDAYESGEEADWEYYNGAIALFNTLLRGTNIYVEERDGCGHLFETYEIR